MAWLSKARAAHGRKKGPTHELQANQLFSQTGQTEQNKGEMKRREAEACGGNERRGRASVSLVGKEMTVLLFQEKPQTRLQETRVLFQPDIRSGVGGNQVILCFY